MDRARLRAIELFADIPDDELALIAARASEVNVEAGSPIAVEGDFGHAFYAIESGTAEVTSNGELLRRLGPGDVFGEVAVLASGRRTASVVATTSLRLIALFKRDVWALEKRAPQAATRLRTLIADRTAGGNTSQDRFAEGDPAKSCSTVSTSSSYRPISPSTKRRPRLR